MVLLSVKVFSGEQLSLELDLAAASVLSLKERIAEQTSQGVTERCASRRVASHRTAPHRTHRARAHARAAPHRTALTRPAGQSS
jgi:hypothetical protein